VRAFWFTRRRTRRPRRPLWRPPAPRAHCKSNFAHIPICDLVVVRRLYRYAYGTLALRSGEQRKAMRTVRICSRCHWALWRFFMACGLCLPLLLLLVAVSFEVPWKKV